jgi:dipeptidyl aminopeptidase/acylaminoacyl peptidase
MRAFQADDLFEIEQIGRYFGGPFSFSPDGSQLVFLVQRAKRTATLHKLDFLWGNDRADAWLVDLRSSAQPINLTHGLEDGAGFWAPAWSPDGRHLALLSTRGGNVTLWIWEAATGELRRVVERGVDLEEVLYRPFTWLAPDLIVCPVLPADEKPNMMTLEMRSAQIAIQVWPKAWHGGEVTASVLDSRTAGEISGHTHGELLLIDIASGTSRTIAPSKAQEFTVSPDGSLIAFLQVIDAIKPDPQVLLDFGVRSRFAVRVVSRGGEVVGDIDVSRDVLSRSLRWSLDGSALTFIGYGADRAAPPRVYTYDVRDGTIQILGSALLDPAPPVRGEPQLHWLSTGEILVYAARTTGDAKPGPTARRDWWLVDAHGGERCLTGDMDVVPWQLVSERSGGTYIGLAAGACWRIEPTASGPQRLALEPELMELVWPASPWMGGLQLVAKYGQAFSQVIAASYAGGVANYYLIDLLTDTGELLPKPHPDAYLAGYEPVRGTLLFAASGGTGTALWISQRPFGEFSQILETNTFLRDIAPGECRRIEYRSLDGEALGAWLILPPDYQEGRRYPVITWVYPGSIAGPTPRYLNDISLSNALNLQIPAAQGYVILCPSMPLAPEGQPDDPMLRLPNGVLPAVERVVELGIADPERIFLMGQSYGGYATYGLITQTQRFKAAVALAGFCNLVSLYGTLDARSRYDDTAHEDQFMPASLESAWCCMGGAPWQDLGRYIRNSPIFQVDRVKTPLLIIQGDMDYVALQQGEEFFRALQRRGVHTRFVRYWGEGHVLQGPANIRDMWRQILAWLEEQSQTAPAAAS